MIGLLLHAAARAVDHVREAAAPLGWVWTYARPSRQQLREEASYWRAIARLTDDRLDEARAEREEWQRRAVAAAQDDLATTVRYTELRDAARALVAALEDDGGSVPGECVYCGTRLGTRIDDGHRYCDDHAPPGALDLTYAPAWRRLRGLLAGRQP